MKDREAKKTLDMLEEYAASDTHKTVFVVVGGEIDPKGITRRPKGEDIVICADSGVMNADRCGLRAALVVGDFDSFPEEKIPKGTEKIKVPKEKDFTDSMLAVNEALKHDADEIVIIGGLSGRLDHTLSNLGILRELSEKHVYATVEDGFNRARYIESTSLLIARSNYKYVSLIAADKKVKGVSVEGCKYPLDNATLECQNQYAISNEVEKNVALISVRKGGL